MRISLHVSEPSAASSRAGTDVEALSRGGADDGTDAHVDPGVPAGALRRHLALLTGDARWAAGAARLHVGRTPLDDAHPAGVAPLLPGARTGLTAQPDDPALDAALAGVHVAVVAGPDAGHVHALPVGGRVTVTGTPRGAPAPATDTGRVRDPALVGVRVEVRRARHAARVRVVGGAGVLVRPRGGPSRRRGTDARRPRVPTGAAGVLPLSRGGVRRRHVGRLPRHWRHADALHVGATVLRVRTDAPAARARRPAPSPWVWSALTSALVGVALAVALRQPLLLVGAAVGLTGLLAARTPASRPTGAAAAGPDGASARTAPRPDDVAAVRTDAARAARTGLAPPARAAGAPQPGDDGSRSDGDTVRSAGGAVALVGAASTRSPRRARTRCGHSAPGPAPTWSCGRPPRGTGRGPAGSPRPPTFPRRTRPTTPARASWWRTGRTRRSAPGVPPHRRRTGS